MTYHARQDETAEWLNYLQPEGLVVGANVLREKGLSPIRQTPLDTEEAAKALRLDPDASRDEDKHLELHDSWTFFEQVLGWPAKFVAGSLGGPAVDPKLTVTVPEHETLLSPDMAVLWNGAAPEGVPAQALVMLHPTLDADGRNLVFLRRMGGEPASAAGAPAARDQYRRRPADRPQHAAAHLRAARRNGGLAFMAAGGAWLGGRPAHAGRPQTLPRAQRVLHRAAGDAAPRAARGLTRSTERRLGKALQPGPRRALRAAARPASRRARADRGACRARCASSLRRPADLPDAAGLPALRRGSRPSAIVDRSQSASSSGRTAIRSRRSMRA